MSDNERIAYCYILGSVAFVIGSGVVLGPGGLLVAFGISAMVVAILDGTNRPPPGETPREGE